MDKQEIYDYLKSHKYHYDTTEHGAVFNMEELSAVELPHPDCIAKNLFVRDDKKKNYYLITVKEDKRINLKEFRRAHGLRNLSFASADDLANIMKLTPGAVSPFGILNDKEHQVTFYLDKAFLGNLIGIHPNDNTATVWLKSEDLVDLIKKHGNEVNIVEL